MGIVDKMGRMKWVEGKMCIVWNGHRVKWAEGEMARGSN